MNDKRTPPVNPNAGTFRYSRSEHLDAIHKCSMMMWKQHIEEMKKDNNNE